MTPEELAREYRLHAYWLVNQLARRYPLRYEDVESAVMLALWQCALRYEPGRSDFRTFFARRAVGAVRDESRHVDHLSRGERKTVAAGGEEARQSPLSIESIVSVKQGEVVEGHAIIGYTDPRFQAVEDRLFVQGVVADLPERERTVIDLHYGEDMTLSAIGRQLGISESRVSQIHEKALDRCRRNIGLLSSRRRRRRIAA